MTTNVKRGAGRPAHTAKTKRHAQRTPLPPRVGTVEAAVRPVDAPEETDPSAAKARDFRAAVDPYGWQCVIYLEGQLCEVTATRGPETLHLAWIAGVHHNDSSTYTIGDRTVKTRNSSAAKKIAARAPEVAEKEFARVGTNTAFRRKPVEPTKGRIPFDPALLTDVELVDNLLGKPVEWHNRFTQVPERGTIPLAVDKVTVTEAPDGQRVVKFCDRATGFRAFRVDSLISVGKASRTRRGAHLLPQGDIPRNQKEAS